MPSTRRVKLIILVLMVALLVGFAGILRAQAQGPTQEELEEGASLYVENCSMCHGMQGEGRVGATLAQDWPSIRPDLRVRDTIINGIEGSPMPAWSEQNGGPLTNEQIDLIVNYILSWQTGGLIEVPPATPVVLVPLTEVPGVSGDPTNGSVLYAQNCTVCHGPQGQGRIGANLTNAFSSIRPDLRLSETVTNGIEGSAMPAWGTSNGGPLSAAQIDDITAYMLTWDSTGAVVNIPTEEPATQNTWLSGAGGVIVLVVLFAAVITIVLLIQRKR